MGYYKTWAYTARYLRSLPTLSTGQADDLKIDDGEHRVWLSRCTVADGEPYDDKVTVETLERGKWSTAYTYNGGL